MSKAVVLFSGGQDSTTCLAWARERYDDVEAVTIDYGQRHEVEIACAQTIAGLWAVPLRILPLNTLSELRGGALTSDDIEVEQQSTNLSTWAGQRKLPSTFVPGRNLLFFTLAAAYGLPRGADTLVTGVCAADRAGYPDCRAEFLDAATAAIQQAMDAPTFTIAAPLVELTKADTWRLAVDLGVLDVVVRETHTCYRGFRSPIHRWGAGCGDCPACHERRDGFLEAFGE